MAAMTATKRGAPTGEWAGERVERPGRTSAVQRAFALIEIIVAENRPMSLAQMAERLSLPKPSVHRLASRLEADGLLESTVVIWSSDHGDGLPRAKRELFDSGIHVPMIVRWPASLRPPKAAPGGEDERLVSFVDLAPTICGLLGVDASANFQGIDVLARDRPTANDRLLFVHVLSPIARADAVLRGGRWKYVVTRERPQGALFDVIADPGESHDLRADKPELAAELARVLGEWQRRQLAYYHYPQYYGHYAPPPSR